MNNNTQEYNEYENTENQSIPQAVDVRRFQGGVDISGGNNTVSANLKGLILGISESSNNYLYEFSIEENSDYDTFLQTVKEKSGKENITPREQNVYTFNGGTVCVHIAYSVPVNDMKEHFMQSNCVLVYHKITNIDDGKEISSWKQGDGYTSFIDPKIGINGKQGYVRSDNFIFGKDIFEQTGRIIVAQNANEIDNLKYGERLTMIRDLGKANSERKIIPDISDITNVLVKRVEKEGVIIKLIGYPDKGDLLLGLDVDGSIYKKDDLKIDNFSSGYGQTLPSTICQGDRYFIEKDIHNNKYILNKKDGFSVDISDIDHDFSGLDVEIVDGVPYITIYHNEQYTDYTKFTVRNVELQLTIEEKYKVLKEKTSKLEIEKSRSEITIKNLEEKLEKQKLELLEAQNKLTETESQLITKAVKINNIIDKVIALKDSAKGTFGKSIPKEQIEKFIEEL